ncbi:Ectonucleotide pyrophosphatase/phosphodiesterase family member 1, partial [Armadillidium nasatum]
GLYPETHGIIDNHFYDPDFDAYFDLGSEESLKGRWWGGEPIWNTVEKQGKLSATMFWPGSDADIQGMRPTYYYVYDTSVPFDFELIKDYEKYPRGTPLKLVAISKDCCDIITLRSKTRLDYTKILEWLALPVDERPSFLCLYFDEPDSTGHEYGPDTSQIDAELPVIDSYIGDLVNGIAELNLTDCVNLIIVSDHGMTTVTEDRSIELDNYVPDLANLASTYEGVLTRIRVNDEDEDQKYEIRKNLTCQLDEMLQYDAISIPKRHHFSHNNRIGDFVVKFTLGYMGNVDDHWYMNGEHGYDNYYENMRAIFIASGPDFQSGGAKFEPFQNIELYNLMCELLGVEPAINNGTEASIYDLLLSPPQYPTIDPVGYSQSLKLPLWTSFTLTSLNSEPPVADWSSDVRLTSSNTQTCSAYDNLKSLNVTMQPLFPNCKLVLCLVIFFSVWSNPAVPSHLFLIVTKCSSSVTDINDCPTSDLDSLAFIFLQYYDLSNCLNEDDFSMENSAKVKDVELLTGLTFFPNLPYKDRTKLVIRIHASLWE